MALQRTRRPRFRSGRSLRSLGSPLNARSLGRFSPPLARATHSMNRFRPFALRPLAFACALLLASVLPSAGCQSTQPADTEVASFELQRILSCPSARTWFVGPFKVRRLAGRVRSSGKALPGSAVAVRSSKTGQVQHQIADDEGFFAFPMVLQDSYLVRICKVGWNAVEFTASVSPDARDVPVVIDLPQSK
jgi:hypothetical protein